MTAYKYKVNIYTLSMTLAWWTIINSYEIKRLTTHYLYHNYLIENIPSISLSTIFFSLSFYLCMYFKEIIYEQWVTTVIYSGINNVLLYDVGLGKIRFSHHFETLDIKLI